MSQILEDNNNPQYDAAKWSRRAIMRFLEFIGVLQYLRFYATQQIDTRLPQTLQEVIDDSDLSRRLYGFQMGLEQEMKDLHSLETGTTTSFRKLLARLSNIDELLAKQSIEIKQCALANSHLRDYSTEIRSEFNKAVNEFREREDELFRRIPATIKEALSR